MEAPLACGAKLKDRAPFKRRTRSSSKSIRCLHEAYTRPGLAWLGLAWLGLSVRQPLNDEIQQRAEP
jgi:hypothetical protein